MTLAGARSLVASVFGALILPPFQCRTLGSIQTRITMFQSNVTGHGHSFPGPVIFRLESVVIRLGMHYLDGQPDLTVLTVLTLSRACLHLLQ
ncbi:hypothetical protein B0T10DRAFT_477880 [Thelonectria olida]|uniref:Secreted protein n=1 Tax=Thelonectria olida TaxID=1576542 RepID=A0A9P9AT32_9HYPO|nr:hypothetical protein B0T10DRAFT_477880 [Thelonectria olida]